MAITINDRNNWADVWIKRAVLCTALLLISSVARAATGTVLYSQPTNGSGAYISQNSPGPANTVPATAYDNFTLSADASVNEITWAGEHVSGTPTISFFTLQIYADNSGTPGASIFTTIVTDFHETPIGIDALGAPYFSYDATGFSTPRLTAGTQYWLSIVATTAGAPPYWDWEFGSGADGSFFYKFPDGSTTTRPADLAFTLYGGGGCQVSVPKWSQCQSPWSGNQYDSHIGTTMCGLGCATTALGIELNAAGVSVLPDSLGGLSFLDPGSLNHFMVSQVGDYNSQHNVEFEKTTLDVGVATRNLGGTKLLYFDDSLNGLNSVLNPGSATDALKTAVCQGHPVIVKVVPIANCQPVFGPLGGHYVVVTGEHDDSSRNPHFDVVDPGCAFGSGALGPITSLDTYNNHFEIRGFVPDPANVSTVELSTGDNADLLVRDDSGNRTGFDPANAEVKKEIPGSSYSQDFLTDNSTGQQATGITHSINLFEPVEGLYHITVMGIKLGTFSLSVDAYSTNGNPQQRFSLIGIAAMGSSSTFELQFSPASGSTSVITRSATFQSTLADISSSLELKLISGQKLADRLSDVVERAAEESAEGEPKEARKLLRNFKDEVIDRAPKDIKEIVAQVLIEDADSLLSQLQGGDGHHEDDARQQLNRQ